MKQLIAVSRREQNMDRNGRTTNLQVLCAFLSLYTTFLNLQRGKKETRLFFQHTHRREHTHTHTHTQTVLIISTTQTRNADSQYPVNQESKMSTGRNIFKHISSLDLPYQKSLKADIIHTQTVTVRHMPALAHAGKYHKTTESHKAMNTRCKEKTIAITCVYY